MADLTQEQIQAMVDAAVAKKRSENPADVAVDNARGHQSQPQPIKLKFGDQEVSFADTDALQNYMVDFQRQAQSQIDQANERGRSAPPAAKPAVSNSERQKADPVKFATLLIDDPEAAMDYIDEMRYGFSTRQVLPKALEITANHDRELNAIGFKQAHPDYVESQENADALMRVLNESKLAFTQHNLALAYSRAKDLGYIKVADVEDTSSDQQNEFEQQSRTSYSTKRNAPPASGTRGAEVAPNFEEQLEELDTDQLLQLAAQLQGN